MEERAAGGKEKKYVLYTVVNDDKGRPGVGVWVVRILLGTLLLAALAVVPYVSLRLAQENDRTLVVFQPVPFHNRSRDHHRDMHGGSHRVTSRRPGNMPVPQLMQSASLVRENYTTNAPKNKDGKSTNTTIVTLHESAVTLSLLEDTNNVTQPLRNQSDEVDDEGKDHSMATSRDIGKVSFSSTPLPELKPAVTNANSDSVSIVALDEAVSQIERNNSKLLQMLIQSNVSKIASVSFTKSPPSFEDKEENETLNMIADAVENSSIKTIKDSTTVAAAGTTATTTSTSRPLTKFSSTKSVGGVNHKLAYVATASSGNHVGGLCIWKTNKNVTNWSYYYDNIPVEFQSKQDNTDHEMRGLLAAIRLWSNQWHDCHVVLRSHHPSIKGSAHPTRLQVVKELDDLSEGHFTYELEWRLGRDDTLVKIAYSLARLYKNFDYWIKEFQNQVNELLGPQDWVIAKDTNRAVVPQSYFSTATKPERNEEIGDLTSLSLY